VTGVVDWTNTSAGPPAVDVAHCRTNLAIMHGTPTADRFGDAYETLTGTRHDAYYDLVDLLDMLPFDHVHDVWLLAGVRDLSDVRSRVDEYVAGVVRPAHSR
jgi:aminoglycoside phosphotransferase (APT) family kinase protein